MRLLDPDDCSERISLVEKYSRCISDYSVRQDALRRLTGERGEADWRAVESAWIESQKAWETLERHLAEHQCLELGWSSPNSAESAGRQILAKAAAAALDIILVADDDRYFIDMNEAASQVLGLARREIVGRRIEEFFSEARGEAIPDAWKGFISEGVQCGICELNAPGRRRRFEYRAKANFAPGLHLSVLRELTPLSE